MGHKCDPGSRNKQRMVGEWKKIKIHDFSLAMIVERHVYFEVSVGDRNSRLVFIENKRERKRSNVCANCTRSNVTDRDCGYLYNRSL